MARGRPSKLTDAVRAEIADLRQKGFSAATIGARLGLSERTVSRAIKAALDNRGQAPVAPAPPPMADLERAAETTIASGPLAEIEARLTEVRGLIAIQRSRAEVDAANTAAYSRLVDLETKLVRAHAELSPRANDDRLIGAALDLAEQCRVWAVENARDIAAGGAGLTPPACPESLQGWSGWAGIMAAMSRR